MEASSISHYLKSPFFCLSSQMCIPIKRASETTLLGCGLSFLAKPSELFIPSKYAFCFPQCQGNTY